MSPSQQKHLSWVCQHPEYEECPVDIRTFIDSPDYMDAKEECWDPIKDDLSDLFQGFDNPEMHWEYTEAVFDEGIGAGKSYKASLIIAYLVYRTLILVDPQKFLNLAKGSSIYFMNMSVRGDQAKKIVFGEIYQRVHNSPWFRNRGYLPDNSIKSELQFPKNINVIPGNSKETYPLGFNLLGGVMDEAAWYIDIDSHDVAEEIYNALHNRIKNRFGNRGMLVMISSPRYVDDFIERKMEEAKTDLRIFTRRRTSWESKPKHMFSGKYVEVQGYSIPEEYTAEAKRDFDRFKRDYMAIPSLALEPYFKLFDRVLACVDPNMFHPFIEGNIMQNWFMGKLGCQYFIHTDLSLTKDATGMAMCHKENGDVFIDMMLRILPPDNGEIDLASIRQLILTLRSRNFTISKCTFDQFQSASSIQELNKSGIIAEQLSVDKDMSSYETLKELLYTSKIHMYKFEPLLSELRRLELVKGKKVDHPSNGSKDVADAVAGCVYSCLTNQNNFGFGFAGGDMFHNRQTDAEALKEAQTLRADGLCHYGFGRRTW